MKKINAAKYNFTSLDTIIRKKLANRRFRASFTEETNRLQLAREIRGLRAKRNMTQKEVAAEANMPQSVVARIESGTHSVSIATLHKIAGVFEKRVGLVGQTQDRR
ncbi:MAG: helix-turn-helix transcriptional regulator [Candidatus Liptonbacteria bacterium]|nr:helix-turn-helix transcriptional regulator [Candidatus Liptonbacteria bacterium]